MVQTGTWHHEAAERGPTYVIREMAPHYTGNGEIVAKGIATLEYAHLIAAAPELLAAAKHGAMSYHHPACKARGEYSGQPERYCTCHVQKCRAAIAKAEGGA